MKAYLDDLTKSGIITKVDWLPYALEPANVIGEGAYGKVYRVVDEDTGEDLAVKRLTIPANLFRRLVR